MNIIDFIFMEDNPLMPKPDTILI